MKLELFVVVILHITIVNANQREHKFKRVMEDKLIEGYEFKLKVRSRVECAVFCEKNNCELFAFHPQTGECFIYYNTHVTDSSASLPGLITFGRKGMCAHSSYSLLDDLGLCLKAYKYSSDEISWLSASEQCERDWGQLMVITHFTKTKAALQTLALPEQYYWLGGTPISGIWTWTDGRPINMTSHWYPIDEPDSYNVDHCLLYEPYSDYIFDGPCADSYPFVCEMEVI